MTLEFLRRSWPGVLFKEYGAAEMPALSQRQEIIRRNVAKRAEPSQPNLQISDKAAVSFSSARG
jgi:hypothetical protein